MVYLTGDTHGNINDFIERINKQDYLMEDDIIIVLGDFGFFFNFDIDFELEQIEYLRYILNGKTLLFLDGNHENFNKINSFNTIDMYNGKVGHIMDNVYHLKRGEVYTFDNKKVFIMGGQESIDKGRRIDNISWWEGENISYSDIENGLNNLEEQDFKIDYVLSHTGPQSIIDDYLRSKFKTNKRFNDKNEIILEQFMNRIKRFKKWYFGHFHMDEKINDKFSIVYEKIIKL